MGSVYDTDLYSSASSTFISSKMSVVLSCLWSAIMVTNPRAISFNSLYFFNCEMCFFTIASGSWFVLEYVSMSVCNFSASQKFTYSNSLMRAEHWFLISSNRCSFSTTPCWTFRSVFVAAGALVVVDVLLLLFDELLFTTEDAGDDWGALLGRSVAVTDLNILLVISWPKLNSKNNSTVFLCIDKKMD